MTILEFIGYSIGGLLVVGPIYLLVFGTLEWLVKRDEAGPPPINSFRAGNAREKNNESPPRG